MYCRECGQDIGILKICPHCSSDNRGKSRLTAGLLQILTGSLGIGRFYLGYTTIGLFQILATLFTWGIAGAVWGFIDGVMILSGKVESDSLGNSLLD
ncbi:MAG: TM2 domain-containing protein [Clostridia bacterium]|nr:TM2 domain-containing protein [Clostridia bacterium]